VSPTRMAVRFLALWLAYTAGYLASSGLAWIGMELPMPPGQAAATLGLTFVLTAADALLASFLTLRSAWRGPKLVLALFTAYFGVAGLLAQIETLVFLKQLVNVIPDGAFPRILAGIALHAALLSVLAPAFFGKLRGASEANPDAAWLRMPMGTWAWKLALGAAGYVVIYLAFGMWVAVPLAGDVFQQFYEGLVLPPWFLPFQFARGLGWVAVSLPVFFLMRGSTRVAALAVAILYPTFLGLPLILPNPFFPDRMRLAHLAETLSSSIVLGGWVYFVLSLGRRNQTIKNPAGTSASTVP